MRRAVLLSALFAGLITPLAALAAEPITGTIEAHKVVLGEKGEEQFLPANEARPQDVIEYQLTYANTGDAVVHNVTITDPVPAGVQYVAKTAKQPDAGIVAFSIDGAKSFHAWPVKITKKNADGKDITLDATPDMVTHIRWTLNGDLTPKGEVSFAYRAKVK